MPATDRLPLGVSAVMLPELDFPEQLALCESLQLAYYVYRPREIPDDLRTEPYSDWGNHRFDLTPKRLIGEGRALSSQLAGMGTTPLCTLPEADSSHSDETWETHFQGAIASGCSRIRISPADHPKELFDYAAHLQQMIARYHALVARARQVGLKVVIEMHVGNAACAPGLVYAIVRDFAPDELGVILDLPNLAQQGYVDPVLAVSVLAPWIDHCHVGAARRIPDARDAMGFQRSTHAFCPLTEGDLYLPSWIGLLRQLGRPVPLIIEEFSPGATGAERLQRAVDSLRSLLKV